MTKDKWIYVKSYKNPDPSRILFPVVYKTLDELGGIKLEPKFIGFSIMRVSIRAKIVEQGLYKRMESYLRTV